LNPYRVFVARLADAPAAPHTVNPYAGAGASARRDNLLLYLTRLAARRPRLLLVGEAPGYRGCAQTGVPFTSRAILLGEPSPFGLFGAAAGFHLPNAPGVPLREATATIVWDTLTALGCLPLLWNACPLHPHPPGNPAANRAPTAAELAAGEAALRELLGLFPVEQVVCVGNKARDALGRWGIAAAAIRHPSHGGKERFAQELRLWFETNSS
jgi:hypothetical protein